MSLEDDFQAALEKVNKLPATPPQATLLELYGLYKQASSGDVSGKRPGMLDIKGRAKYDAWAKLEGTSRDDAKRSYIELADRLADEA